MDCPYDLTVNANGRSVHRLTLMKSLNKYRPLGKLSAILSAILNRSVASPEIKFSPSINNDFFMLNIYLDCRLDCSLVW